MQPFLLFMYLSIDIGNTLQKAAVFSPAGDMLLLHKCDCLTVDIIQQLVENHSIDHAILSAVGKCDSDLLSYLKSKYQLIILSSNTPLPIKLCYQSPTSLGPDRIANAVGAHALYPSDDVLSVQMGTCIVYDFINSKGEYLGGAISPGIDMRLKALHSYTFKLPSVGKQSIDFFIGRTTEQSILSGVINGLVNEVEGFIYQYRQDYPHMKCIAVGGDVDYLHLSKKITIFAPQNLVLMGLYEILRFNVEN